MAMTIRLTLFPYHMPLSLLLRRFTPRLQHQPSDKVNAMTNPQLPSQPLSIRLLYGSALAIQSFDSFAFYTISPLLFPNRADFSHPATRFFLRQNATLLLPFIFQCWLLRDYHIRHTKVGQIVGATFALFHASAVAMYSWSRWVGGEYRLEPFGLIASLHGSWALGAVWGLFAS